MSNKNHITIHHLKLYKPSKNKQAELEKLSKNWNKAIRSALKIVKRWGFTAYAKSHKHTYYVSRNNFDLPSQVAIEANRKAVETYKSAENAEYKRQIGVRLVIKKSFDLINNDGKYYVKINCCNKKNIYCPLAFGQYQLKYIESNDYKIKTAELYFSKGEWYIDLVMEYKQEKKKHDTYLGVDLGIVKIATFSIIDKKENILHQECASGEELRFKRMRYKQKRKKKSKKAGSEATSLIAENRLCKELNFKIANRIIELAQKYNSMIVFEDLKNIRKNITNDNTLNNYEKNSWAFYQLKKSVEHKADMIGLKYREVNPKDTSQICSVCGEKGYRMSQNRFLCNNLHLQNADYNASVNIAKRSIK